MSKIAVEASASMLVSNLDNGGTYDSTKWNLKSLVKQRTDLGTPFIGPLTVGIARPFETTTIPGAMVYAWPFSTTKHWVFFMDNAAAAATRRIIMYEYDLTTSAFSYIGFITMTPPFRTASGNVTAKGFAMSIETYSTGTASVSGTAVTGTSTLWATNKIPGGCAIGFGSTDPTQITTWYDLLATAAPTDSAATLTASAGTITNGPYVIIDMRAVWVQTHATAVNGSGLFCAKGLAKSAFVSGGTAVGVGTTVDNIRVCYWLSEAAVQVELAPVGMVLAPIVDRNTQFVYVLDTTTNPKWNKYNIRTAETYAAGVNTTFTDFIFKTGALAVTGVIAAINNGCFGNLGHGPTIGVDSLFFCTTTRVYASRISDITSGSTTWQSFQMTENPAGSSTTFALTNVMNQVEYEPYTDRLIVLTTGATGFKSYVTQFRTDAGQMDHVILSDTKQQNQSTIDANAAIYPVSASAQMNAYARNGVVYLVSTLLTAIGNICYAVPLGVDWSYTGRTSQRAITPALSSPNCNKYGRVYAIRDRIIGGDALGQPTDPFKLYYRTTGITDNSGAWVTVPEPNDLSGVAGATQIQFALEFKTISERMLGSRVFLVGVTYDDLNTDSHYQTSIANSDLINKRFAFRFVTAFGSATPAMKIVLTNADTGAVLLTDYTATPTLGTFEKSTNDGSSWGAYNTTDVANLTTVVRYTPTSLADGIKVKATFMLA